ncbi:hypothetical protein QYE76_027375 [Lolium multiflorum]|uniref:Uncharacterized protein n=1 Tax=Lolium multiflorum TaxID=4521 RepID=A0AAD8QLQ9_LOLMU|nr:hypothetical protein QYE76_027375 [Lolium multiflorum]
MQSRSGRLILVPRRETWCAIKLAAGWVAREENTSIGLGGRQLPCINGAVKCGGEGGRPGELALRGARLRAQMFCSSYRVVRELIGRLDLSRLI